MEFLFELVVTFLFSYPGALVRYVILRIFGSKKTLKECVNQDMTQNALLGFLVVVILYVSIYAIVF